MHVATFEKCANARYIRTGQRRIAACLDVASSLKRQKQSLEAGREVSLQESDCFAYTEACMLSMRKLAVLLYS